MAERGSKLNHAICSFFRTGECEKIRPFICEVVPSNYNTEHITEPRYEIVPANSGPSADDYIVAEGDICEFFNFNDGIKFTLSI